MTLHKNLLGGGFPLPNCEKHFHDTDEVWLVLCGRGTGYWIDHEGRREDFDLEAGDVWLVPAGYEHGSDGIGDDGTNSADFEINVLIGTEPPGSHEFGHHYMEKEGYIPSFELKKEPTSRYADASGPVAK